jgi:nitroimidazol reductase NimA-like FMN-containing flavoprotein (pyridoxamine 5'-phosphate oxidase superfamily)
VTIGGLPVILPVNFSEVDGDIVFRTSKGTKLHAATERAVVAFEADAYDDAHRAGWSVLVVGRSRTVVDADERAALEACAVAAWADGERNEFVRIHPEFISGRRIAGREQ